MITGSRETANRIADEVDISRGLPGFHLVGLPGAEVRESRQRVLAAMRELDPDYQDWMVSVNNEVSETPRAIQPFRTPRTRS